MGPKAGSCECRCFRKSVRRRLGLWSSIHKQCGKPNGRLTIGFTMVYHGLPNKLMPITQHQMGMGQHGVILYVLSKMASGPIPSGNLT